LARPGQDQVQRFPIQIIEYAGDSSANLRGSPTSGLLGAPGSTGGTVEYTKSFHLHEAPEQKGKADVGPVETKTKKHYQVIFVKAPNDDGAAARQALTQHEQKTVVYVLSKKNDASNANFEAPAPISAQPEVVYVKYNNQADSEHVVKKIQESYQEGGEGYQSSSAFAKLVGGQVNSGYTNRRKFKY
jgi:hypothetical protein